MKYNKPKVKKVQGKMPPITTNFAPPPVERPDGPGGDNPDEDFLNNRVIPPVVFFNNGNNPSPPAK